MSLALPATLGPKKLNNLLTKSELLLFGFFSISIFSIGSIGSFVGVSIFFVSVFGLLKNALYASSFLLNKLPSLKEDVLEEEEEE